MAFVALVMSFYGVYYFYENKIVTSLCFKAKSDTYQLWKMAFVALMSFSGVYYCYEIYQGIGSWYTVTTIINMVKRVKWEV